jgi:CxxC motif-containing protein (DUF1111 family)
MTLYPRTRLTRSIACATVAIFVACAHADLTGTTLDLSVSHTGVFATTTAATYTYGTTQVEPDPNAPALTMEWSSPSPNNGGFANSIKIDFSEFSLNDFDGETGSLEITGLAELVDSGAVFLLDGTGQVVGVAAGSGSTITASWSVNDVLPFLEPSVTIAWNSEESAGPLTPQPAAGAPLDDLTPGQLERFDIGKVAFERTFLDTEGLGPVFNKASCANCHNNPIGGSGSQTVNRFGLAGKGGFDDLSQFGGSLLQVSSINPECQEDFPDEANVFALRLTPSILGGGLVEAIPDGDILANELPGPGISGRARLVNPLEDPGSTIVGRFGWKGDVATLLTFSADAGLNEMGITNRLVMNENDPNGINPPDLLTCDLVPDPEDGPEGGIPGAPHWIDRTRDFQRFLAAPPQTPKSGMTGEVIFNNIGCAECHTPSYTTSNDGGLEDAIRDKTIRPYTDFLIHDMGLASDFIASGDAGEREMRTPSLWGLRLRDPLWHDGRFAAGTFASRVTDAILEHDAIVSEGQASGQAFAALPQMDKDALIAFLDSLGRREFDVDGDNHVDLPDFLDFVACLGSGYTPDDACAVHDIDQDGDVDLDDFASFELVYEGAIEDCNANLKSDIRDIVDGTSTDTNGNGTPDECDCPTDCSPPGGNGQVNIDDLLAVINAFGAVGPNDCDVEPVNPDGTVGNGAVNIDDVLAVINAFGPCL